MRSLQHASRRNTDIIEKSPTFRPPTAVYCLLHIPRLLFADYRLPLVGVYCLLFLLLTACTASEAPPVHPTAAAVLPQPTNQPSNQLTNQQSRIVAVRVTHVRALSEIVVQAGDQVQLGQALARLKGYARELDRDVQLVEWELTQAKAKLEEARRRAVSDHKQQITRTEARITELDRRLAELTRQKQSADARLSKARTTTAYRQRWLDILAPLEEFDPWGDIPYLVGSQSGPKGPRSDLAYREAVAKAKYDLRQAGLAQQIAEQEAAGADARLEEAELDLEAARTTLEQLQATSRARREASPPSTIQPSSHPAIQSSSHLAVYEASVRINELRLAQARAELEKTVVRSLVAGQVLDVRVDRIDGSEATVTVQITAARPDHEVSR